MRSSAEKGVDKLSPIPRNGKNTHIPTAGACSEKAPEGKKLLSLADLQALFKQEVKVKIEGQASMLNVKGIPQHTELRPYTNWKIFSFHVLLFVCGCVFCSGS